MATIAIRDTLGYLDFWWFYRQMAHLSSRRFARKFIISIILLLDVLAWRENDWRMKENWIFIASSFTDELWCSKTRISTEYPKSDIITHQQHRIDAKFVTFTQHALAYIGLTIQCLLLCYSYHAICLFATIHIHLLDVLSKLEFMIWLYFNFQLIAQEQELTWWQQQNSKRVIYRRHIPALALTFHFGGGREGQLSGTKFVVSRMWK